MTLILDGTNGLSDVDGSAATPALRGSDANTGIFFPAADTIAFSEGGAEAMRIDSDGDVGIGTTTPAKKLDILSNTSQDGIRISGSANPRLTIIDTTTPVQFDALCTDTEAVLRTDTNHPLVFSTNGTERMRIDSAGAVLAGTASSVGSSPMRFQAKGGAGGTLPVAGYSIISGNDEVAGQFFITASSENSVQIAADPQNLRASSSLQFATDGSERARIDSSGNLLVGTTSTSRTSNGVRLVPGTDDGTISITNARSSGGTPIELNRQVSDGVLIAFYQADTLEGNISVSGTTVSYNGGHLARYAQTVAAKDETLVKGTVLSNLDAMNVYTDAEGNPVDNEQLNKVKVSDVEGDVNVAGVFVNWTHDDAHDVDEINMAMTGDMIIRIAQGVTVVRGDLLMSAGDGTAKPQGDDIVRSKTVAKVTSNHVTCTYADGSYCVPCVLMAC